MSIGVDAAQPRRGRLWGEEAWEVSNYARVVADGNHVGG
jgi:hypothetical protein